MPVKYISYIPETTDGQAILDNFTRTRRVLRYRENGKVIDRLKRGLPLYEVEQTEKVGEDSENLLLRGECLSACAYLKDKGIKVDLVYIDPPFASGLNYAKAVYLRKNPKIAGDLYEKEKEIAEQLKAGEDFDIDEYKAFEEKMYGDIWNKEAYLNWMYENLIAIKLIMADTASIYVHLDWHIGHYVKILLDEVFGESNFRNEVVVHYTAVGLKAKSKKFHQNTESIYFYVKNIDSKYTFNDVFYKLDKPRTASKHEFDSETGKANRVRNEAGEIEYFEIWENKADNFIEVPALRGEQKIGYATEKHPLILERVIKASSNEGMIVADFFGGSGTTAAVAHHLNRKFITSDVGINSLLTTRDRLKENGAAFEMLDIKDGVSLFRNPIQTMDKLKSLIIGLRNEDKLDKFWEGAIEDSKEGLMPVYIPNLLDHSTKVLDIPLMNRILNEAMPDLAEDIKKVVVYYIDIEDRHALDKFISEKNETNFKIELRDLKEILDDVVLGDIVDYDLRPVKNGFEIEFNSFVSDRLNQKIDEYNQKKALQGKQRRIDEIENGNGEDVPKKKTKFKPLEISDNGLELIEFISLDCTNSKDVWKSDVELKIDKNSFVILNGKKTKDFWNGKIFTDRKPLRMKVRNIAGDESIFEFIRE